MDSGTDFFFLGKPRQALPHPETNGSPEGHEELTSRMRRCCCELISWRGELPSLQRAAGFFGGCFKASFPGVQAFPEGGFMCAAVVAVCTWPGSCGGL